MATHPIVPATGTLTVYATSWCPYCRVLLAECERAGTPVRVIDVERDDAAAAWVCSVNGGNRVVPTVVFPGGAVETNPEPTSATSRV